MREERIKTLEKYLLEDPEDTFSLYALALELRVADPERAAELFDHLLRAHPEYEGTYYQAAEFFAELGQREKAEEIYEKGIAVLSRSLNHKALHELRNAYQNFQFED